MKNSIWFLLVAIVSLHVAAFANGGSGSDDVSTNNEPNTEVASQEPRDSVQENQGNDSATASVE